MLYGYVAIFALVILWSPSFAFMKIAGIDYPPITIAAFRICCGALILILICWQNRNFSFRKITINQWLHAAIMGFFSAGLPFIFFAYAVKHIITMWASIFTGTIPVMTAILGYFLLDKKPLALRKTLGIISGLAGILVLTIPTILDNEIGIDTYSLAACFVSSCCYAVGIVYSKKFFTVPGIAAPCLQLTTVSLWIVPLALLVEHPWQVQLSGIWPTISIVSLAVLCTAFAFVLYFWINRNFGPQFLSSIGYLIPILGTSIGVFFLHEPLTLTFCGAFALVILGIALMNSGSN